LGPEGAGIYRLLRWVLRGPVRRLRQSLLEPRAAQEQVLAELLEQTRDSAFGRAHGLDAVRSLADFRAAVPVQGHPELRPWLDRVGAGEEGVLTRSPVRMLLETSGTTGAPKHLPVTDAWAKCVQEAQALWTLGLLQETPAVRRGAILSVVSPEKHGLSAGGVPIGSNTGRIRRAQPGWMRRRYAVPDAVVQISDPVARQYALLRFALGAKISSWTTANPSMILLLCRRLMEWQAPLSEDLAQGTLRHGPGAGIAASVREALEQQLRPEVPPEDWRPCSIWPLAAVNCWTQGPATYFAARLPEALGGSVSIRDVGLRASEGFFAFPMRASDPGSVLWTAGHLLEFIGDDGAARWAWELEEGEEVRMVVSTQAGLLRYDLADRVAVVGRAGRVPLVRFVGKHGRYLNCLGEKVTEAQVSAAMDTAASQAGECPVGFCVRIRIAEVPVYEVALEGGGLALVNAWDRALAGLNVEYAGKRSSGRLGPPVPVSVAPGGFARYRELRALAGAPEGQVKDPIVALDEETWALLVSL
jgi:hypothetical protein